MTDSLRVRTTAVFGSAVPQALSGILPRVFLPVSKIPLECKNCASVIKPSNFHKNTLQSEFSTISFSNFTKNKLTFHRCSQCFGTVRAVISNPSSRGHRGDDNGGPGFVDYVISRSIFRIIRHRKRQDLLTLSRRPYVMTAVCTRVTTRTVLKQISSDCAYSWKVRLDVVVFCGCNSKEKVCIPQK